MWFIYCTGISLLFSVIPKPIDAYSLYWHKFENFVPVESVLFHLQLFMNSHFPLLIPVESVISHVLHQWPKHYGGWSCVSDLHDKLFGLLQFGVAVCTIVRKWKWLVVSAAV